jgi:hydroxymethylbilane synthase
MLTLQLGTRGSLLALTQSELIAAAVRELGAAVELKQIKTSGDKKQGTTAASKGDKKDWILELEQEVLAGTIDFAVHSGKDVPSDFEPGTEIISVLKREDPRDVFIGRQLGGGKALCWNDLPHGAVVGTASLRRQASIRRIRGDLKLVEHRGNVPTRLTKLAETAELSGIVLARAGIERLGITDCVYEPFAELDVMPAVNQGILCIQFREDRSDLRQLFQKLQDHDTQVAFTAERACVAVLGADCKSSVSVYARTEAGNVLLSVRIMLPDGSATVEKLDSVSPAAEAAQLGSAVAHEILAAGGKELLEASREF